MKTIMLVEDTVHLSEEIADILRLEGHNVILANSGFRALELLSGSTASLIITDLLMPGMDGFELIEQIRMNPLFKSIPIIILSAKTSSADKLRGKEVGANAFIQKPCKAHELVAAIDALIA